MRITKELKKKFSEKAKELAEKYNPYIDSAIEYAIDMKPMFLFQGESMTKEEIDNAYVETAVKDIERGYTERMVGYYDKWCRCNHPDEGAAYDAGQKIAADTGKCPEEFQVIDLQS